MHRLYREAFLKIFTKLYKLGGGGKQRIAKIENLKSTTLSFPHKPLPRDNSANSPYKVPLKIKSQWIVFGAKLSLSYVPITSYLELDDDLKGRLIQFAVSEAEGPTWGQPHLLGFCA